MPAQKIDYLQSHLDIMLPRSIGGEDGIGLSNRAVNSLESLGVYTVEQLLNKSRGQLLGAGKLIGEKTMLEILEALNACGFQTVDRLNNLRGRVERGEEKIDNISREVLVQLRSIGLKLTPSAEAKLNQQPPHPPASPFEKLFRHPISTQGRH